MGRSTEDTRLGWTRGVSPGWAIHICNSYDYRNKNTERVGITIGTRAYLNGAGFSALPLRAGNRRRVEFFPFLLSENPGICTVEMIP